MKINAINVLNLSNFKGNVEDNKNVEKSVPSQSSPIEGSSAELLGNYGKAALPFKGSPLPKFEPLDDYHKREEAKIKVWRKARKLPEDIQEPFFALEGMGFDALHEYNVPTADKMIDIIGEFPNLSSKEKCAYIRGVMLSSIKPYAPLVYKILDNKELRHNPSVITVLSSGIAITYTNPGAANKMLDKIMDTEELHKNKNIMDNIGLIVASVRSVESFEAKAELMDKIFSDEELLSNNDVMSRLSDLIIVTDEENVDLVKQTLDRGKPVGELLHNLKQSLAKGHGGIGDIIIVGLLNQVQHK